MKQILVYVLFGLGCALYIYGLVKAATISLPKSPDVTQMPEFLATVVTSIGGVLALNFGAVTGLLITNAGVAGGKFSLVAAATKPSTTQAQIWAAFVYFLCLLAMGIVWCIKDFTPDTTKVVAIIPEMTKTLIGVVAGAAAVVLATPTPQK